MILRDGDERFILNMRHETSSYSNKPQKESINMIDIYNVSHEDYLEDLFANEKITNHVSGNPTLISDPIVSSSPTLTSLEESDLIWEECEAYLASDSFPPGSDDTDFDPKGDLCLIEELLNDDCWKHEKCRSLPKLLLVFYTGAVPVVRAPYRLTPSEMKELADQL
ncbi:hypothetical protein Tco_0125425 [Tanacetum coccineum]